MKRIDVAILTIRVMFEHLTMPEALHQKTNQLLPKRSRSRYALRLANDDKAFRWQVVIAGGRLQPGTTKLEEGCEQQEWNVLATEGNKEDILKHVTFVQKVVRRRPFMIRSLETVLKRSVQCLVG